MPTTHGGSAAKNGISWLRVSLRATTISPFASTANLKHPLRQIETNPRDSRQIPDRLAHGRLPFRWVDDNDHLGTLMPFGAPSTPSFADDSPNALCRRSGYGTKAPGAVIRSRR